MNAAVFFPGIGYRFNRPLLKAPADFAAENGIKIIKVDYDGFPENAKQNLDSAVRTALDQTEKILEGIDWSSFEKIFFIAKSIGTAAACIYADLHGIKCRKILFTPIPQTFSVHIEDAVAFYGTSDPWISQKDVTAGCEKNSIPLFVYDGMNHSLLCEDEAKNLVVMDDVMKKTFNFISAVL